MKYVLMCGSNHNKINGTPRQLVKIGGERLLDRTIRLLKQSGVTDIAITATDKAFNDCGVPVIKYDSKGMWINCFMPSEEPICYIFGDVFFSPEAIERIVETPTDSIEFFASAPPFDSRYSKPWGEPFAFKVVDQKFFRSCIEEVKEIQRRGEWQRDPLAWELWQVVKRTPINFIYYGNYVVINDYTCDVDEEKDIAAFEKIVECENSEVRYLIHATPKRMWYVENYLIPSMFDQGIDYVDVWEDIDNEGNLISCMKSFKECGQYPGGTWHLQDDVIICKKFAEITSKGGSEILCGFTCDKFAMPHMQYSFPCIYIPNEYAAGCAEWFYKPRQQQLFSNFIQRRKCDDEVFMAYAQEMKLPYKNLNPCLVDHIDWMLGGSVANYDRYEKQIRAKFWEDEDLVKDLEVRLANR